MLRRRGRPVARLAAAIDIPRPVALRERRLTVRRRGPEGSHAMRLLLRLQVAALGGHGADAPTATPTATPRRARLRRRGLAHGPRRCEDLPQAHGGTRREPRRGARESVGLLGPNGAGKTTVFYMITGLVPADAGRITIDGQDVTRLPCRRARLGIVLPRRPRSSRLTVEQNIMAVLGLVEPDKRRRREQLDLLEEFDIARLRNRPRSRSRAASAGAARSRARSPRGPRSCCSTSRLPASIRSRSATSRAFVRHLTERQDRRRSSPTTSVRRDDEPDRSAPTSSAMDELTQGKPAEIIANTRISGVSTWETYVHLTAAEYTWSTRRPRRREG